MVEILMLKLPHEFEHVAIEIAKSPDTAVIPLDLVEPLGDAVTGHECAHVIQLEPDVDPLILEALDPPVEAVERLGVEMPGTVAAVVGEKVRPGSIDVDDP